MLERLETLVQHFARDFRWADLVEILLVGLVFYLFVTWLRSSITRRGA